MTPVAAGDLTTAGNLQRYLEENRSTEEGRSKERPRR